MRIVCVTIATSDLHIKAIMSGMKFAAIAASILAGILIDINSPYNHEKNLTVDLIECLFYHRTYETVIPFS